MEPGGHPGLAAADDEDVEHVGGHRHPHPEEVAAAAAGVPQHVGLSAGSQQVGCSATEQHALAAVAPSATGEQVGGRREPDGARPDDGDGQRAPQGCHARWVLLRMGYVLVGLVARTKALTRRPPEAASSAKLRSLARLSPQQSLAARSWAS